MNNNSGELILKFRFTMETYVFEDVIQLGQGPMNFLLYQYINQDIIDKLIVKRAE